MEFTKGDTVEVSVSSCGGSRRIAGKFEATVITDPNCGVVAVVPSDWDEACDVYSEEGSLSWTDIRDLRDYGRIEDVSEEDLELLEPGSILYTLTVTMPVPRDADEICSFMIRELSSGTNDGRPDIHVRIIPGLASEGLKRTRDALRRGVITVGMTRDQALAALRADRALHA